MGRAGCSRSLAITIHLQDSPSPHQLAKLLVLTVTHTHYYLAFRRPSSALIKRPPPPDTMATAGESIDVDTPVGHNIRALAIKLLKSLKQLADAGNKKEGAHAISGEVLKGCKVGTRTRGVGRVCVWGRDPRCDLQTR